MLDCKKRNKFSGGNHLKKLIAIDLDGTTLNKQSLITKKTEKTLKQAVTAGHYVCIVTGRPYRISQQFYRQLDLNTPMVNFNGALVHIPESKWSQEKESTIPREIAFDILKQKDFLNFVFLAVENKENFYIDSFNNFDSVFFSSNITEKNLLTTTNLVSAPNSIMIRTLPNKTKPVADFLEKTYGNTIDVRTWGGPTPILEIVAKGIHKANGLERIANYLSVERSDILAFGDEHNDAEMLAYAGWGVAMNNATETIKTIADDVTDKTNDEDGVANYLKTYLHLSD